MITATRTVNFGSRRASLATVGYKLLTADGTEIQARTTTGIAEIASGIYSCNIEFSDNFIGIIIWDTGQATPLYASDDFDYREIAVPYIQNVGGASIWTDEEKKKVIRLLKSIAKTVNAKDTGLLLEAIRSIKIPEQRAIPNYDNKFSNIDGKNTQIMEAMEALAGAIEVIIDNKRVNSIIEEVEHVKN